MANESTTVSECCLKEMTGRLRTKLVEDNEMASSVPLQAPTHDKVHAHEQQDERKRKLSSYIPDWAAAVNNVSEVITQLPASKKICYEHYDDDDEEILRPRKRTRT